MPNPPGPQTGPARPLAGDRQPLRGLPIVNNEDAQTCRRCEGKCCKTLPGAFLPEQLDQTNLAEGVASGKLVLAWWDGDPRPDRNCFDVDCDGSCPRCTAPDRLMRAYYVRPRNVNSPAGSVDSTSNGACTLLGPRGCTLSFEERPAGCQNLLVNRADPGNCNDYAVTTGSFKHYAALAWVERQDELAALARRS